MSCAYCQSTLPEGAKFCKVCGKAVAAACPRCQSPLAEGTKFCKVCGARLTAQTRDMPAPPLPSALPPESSVSGAASVISGKKARGRTFLPAGVFVLLVGAGIAAYVAFSGEKAPADATDAPGNVSQGADPAVSQVLDPAAPEASPVVPPESLSPVLSAEAAPVPAEAAAPPPKTAAGRRPVPVAEAPEPEKPKTCEGVSGFSILLCRTEGPARFWHCVPDGVNWNNDIPGCQRDAGVRNRPY
ncbi:MAG: zinc ribbon domain-containing protein [Zoogloeaceae bacterium]|jgi:Meckel syndrome type 1 protein|nr:zinc ribbon domain-containing protein [Zoogloeaceae bacterium]